MRKRWGRLGAALALTIGFAGSTVEVAAENVLDNLVRGGGVPPDLFLVYTGDVIGYIDPCG